MTACWGFRNSERFDDDKFFKSKKSLNIQKVGKIILVIPDADGDINPKEKSPEFSDSSEDSEVPNKDSTGKWPW